MKSTLYLKSIVILVAVAFLACGAFAATDTQKASFQISSPVQIGSTQLAAGDYVAKWEGQGPDVQVSLIRAGKVVATVPARLVQLDQKADRDRADLRSGANGSQELTALRFNGKKVALDLAPGTTEAQKNKSPDSASE